MAQELKTRITLAKYFGGLGFRFGAEIGVFTGYYSEVLCQAMPGLRLLCIDPWAWGKYQRHEEEALARLAPYDTVIMKTTSEAAAKEVEDSSLDFVYIDAAHDYEHVKQDIELWTPKVRIGGIVSGDDFYEFPSGKGGVQRAVCEYTSNNRYNLKLTDWNEDNPIRDDRQPSFYFVRTH